MKRLVLLVAALSLVAPAPVAAAAGCAQATVADLEDEVMCPLCGTSLGLARESPQARRERAFIARQIASCRSKAEIKDALVAEFGPAVLAEPRNGGFTASAYLVPAVGGCAVLGLVAVALLRWRRRGGGAAAGRPSPSDGLADDDARRLELELERWR